jgi:hypothetical protein
MNCITCLTSVFLAAAVTSSALAAVVLFPSGVDAGGNVLPIGSADPHFTVLETGNPAVLVNTHPSWIPNSTTSAWIWETVDGLPVNVTRTFRTTFDLTGYNPSLTSITGIWSSDNTGVDILLNGVGTGNTAGNFTQFYPFSVGAGFVEGVNTLDFVVNDVGVISGFRVDNFQLDLTAVPEPETYAAFAGAGLAGWALLRRRLQR